jgi:hypothetical protein
MTSAGDNDIVVAACAPTAFGIALGIVLGERLHVADVGGPGE